jgi:hypothetical protein
MEYLNYEKHAANNLEANLSSLLITGTGMLPHKIITLFLENYTKQIRSGKDSSDFINAPLNRSFR